MEPKLKTISPDGIAHALVKAERYRFLNEPEEAESICRDVLEVAPDHQTALRMLGLCLTDQFTGQGTDRYADAAAAFDKLTDKYENLYYRGILQERRAKTQLRAGHPPHTITGRIEEAMRLFQEAEAVRPHGNDDSMLRWNRCARLLASLPRAAERHESGFDDSDSPPVTHKGRTARTH